MRTMGVIRVQETENLAIFREIYGQGPIRGSDPAAPAMQDPRGHTNQDKRDYRSNREENEQWKVEGFKAKLRTLLHDLEGQIDDMTLGNVKHKTRQIEKLIETHDKLYAKLRNIETLTFVDIKVEDQDRALTTHSIKVYPTLRRLSADLYDREQTIKDETNLHNEERR